MRSGVGSFWPRSRRLDFLEDFLPCELLCAAEPVGLFAAGLCAFTEMENTPSPAARSSDEARCVAFRRFRRIACRSVIAGSPPGLSRTGTPSQFGRYLGGEES